MDAVFGALAECVTPGSCSICSSFWVLLVLSALFIVYVFGWDCLLEMGLLLMHDWDGCILLPGHAICISLFSSRCLRL